MACRTRAGAFGASTLADGLVGTFDGLWLDAADIALCAPSAVAFAGRTAADSITPTTIADSLVGSREGLGLVSLAGLQIRESSGFVVHVSDLLVSDHVV
jgi:hypothetical protein